MKTSKRTRPPEFTRRDLLKFSGLALGGLAVTGSAGKAIAATAEAPKAIRRLSLEKYPDPGWMRITFCGTWYTPRINQACNSVFVEVGNDANDSYVFDCGSGVVGRYVGLGVPFSRMDKIFLTHLHGDHMSDLVTIYCFGPSSDRKSPLYVFGPSGDTKNEGTKFFCEKLYELCKWHRESFSFLQTGYVKGGDGYDLKAQELHYMQNPGLAYNKNGVKISHFPAIHARDGAISYKLEWNGRSMVFTGDTKPNDYVLKNAEGVDILIHEMTTTPEVWTTKQTGLTSGTIYEQYLQINKEVIENSHTVQGAYGYILSQTNPRLGVATHFPNDPDLVKSGLDAMSCSGYPREQCVIAQDLTVITIDPDGNIAQAVAGVCGSCDEYRWFTGAPLTGALAPSKYDGPLAQFNDKLLENVIPDDDYDGCNL
jgi:ribonuclease Z